MFDDPKIMTVLIAGFVSLIISAISGIYTVLQNRKKFDLLRNELLAKAGTESFIKTKEAYLDAYREFEPELVSINQRNPDDGTELLQFSINFHAGRARDFYLRNKAFLQTNELNELYDEITSAIESGNLNNPKNHSRKVKFANNLLRFFSKLNEQALSVN